MNKRNYMPYVYVIISALVMGISRYNWGLGAFAFIGLMPLFRYFSLEEKGRLTSLKAAISYSLVNTLVAYHWVGLVTLPGLFGMIILFSLYYWLLFSVINYLWQRGNWLRWLGIIFSWMSFETFLFLTELRFPWLNIGYSLVKFNYLLQIADLGGIHLLSLGVLLVNILLYLAFDGHKKCYTYLGILCLLWLGYGYVRYNEIIMTQARIEIKMLQPSLGLDKFDVSMNDIIAKYDKHSYYASLDKSSLVIWPEAAIPDLALLPNRVALRDKLLAIADKYEFSIFFGTTDAKPAPEDYHYDSYYYNAATLINYPELTISEPYYKQYLVPVGERMPFLKALPFLWKLEFGQANWEYGHELKYYTVKNKKGEEFKFSPQICYEILFPKISNEMARNDVDFIVNLTNDAWFKRSVGTFQHAMMTRVRAIETRKPILRCANTGHTMAVAPNGDIKTYSKLYDEGIYSAPVFTTKSKSIYVQYLYWFPYVFFIGFFLVIGFSLLERKKGAR